MLGGRTLGARSGSARAGKLGWASYDTGQRTTMLFGAESKLISNPTPAIRQAWEAIPDALIGSI